MDALIKRLNSRLKNKKLSETERDLFEGLTIMFFLPERSFTKRVCIKSGPSKIL